jgi:hypothetical protein
LDRVIHRKHNRLRKITKPVLEPKMGLLVLEAKRIKGEQLLLQ